MQSEDEKTGHSRILNLLPAKHCAKPLLGPAEEGTALSKLISPSPKTRLPVTS